MGAVQAAVLRRQLARRDAEEMARRAAEERARRDVEERARRDGEERARRAAEEMANELKKVPHFAITIPTATKSTTLFPSISPIC